MHHPPSVTTFLFTDIEGSTRLWEREPERMRPALALHDAIARSAVEAHRGTVVKTTGDGIHAVFDDPVDAVEATLQLQQALLDPDATAGIPLRVRCGLHLGAVERRDNDFFGTPVNRTARIMSAAHGGQVLVSKAVADLVGNHLPPGVALKDLGALRLRDLASPERVFQVMHSRLRRDFPALRSLESTPNNLPQQVTPFICRERELSEVKALLAKTRLLTLLGTGGLGKTRLSLQAAVDVMDDYPDGVWFVELAPLTDPQLVPQAVASVLGVKEEAGRPVIEALMSCVSDRQCLVVLDNCEHLVQACADLASDLLQSGPHCRILASSREPLHTPAETTYHVLPLAVPTAREGATPDSLSRYEAVRLFVDRAVAAQPAFRITQQNADAVARICHRLDGIPLALELAAARVRSLSVEKIAERLGDRFSLLTGGSRTALPRQQTLRALIDWSYDLLSDPERVLLRRLAVFAGGFTLEAAEAVGAGGEIEEMAVLDVLTHLVEKSLVGLEADGERYGLLETMRQYAQEKLALSGEEAATRGRHLVHYADFAEQARPELLGPQQASWLSRLDVERENLLAAHAWCGRDDRAGPAGLRLVVALKNYFLRRGLLGLGQQVMDEALAHPGAQARDAARSRALFSRGQLAYVAGRYDDARRRLEESLSIAREIGDEQRAAAVLQPLGLVLSATGDLAGARQCYDTAIALAQQIGDKREIAMALNNRAQLHQLERELDEALPLLERVLSLTRDLEDHENVALALLNLAMVEIGRGHQDRARRFLGEALAIAEQMGSRPVGQSVVEVCAGFAAACGEPEAAAYMFGAAQGQIARTGLQRSTADEAFLAPLIAKVRSELSENRFDSIAQSRRSVELSDALTEVRRWLSRRQPVSTSESCGDA